MGYLKEELKVKRPYGMIADFDTADGVWRYRDIDTGLWRQYTVNCLDKEGKAKKGWGSDGEIFGEGEDSYFETTNGVKVFRFPKKEKKDKK